MEHLLSSVETVQGIGADSAERLATIGIEVVADLLRPTTADALTSAGLSLVRFRQWRQAADLLRAEGVTPDLAEVLVADRTESLRELSEHGLRTLELAVKRGIEADRISEAPSLYRLAAIQRDAVRLRYSGMVYGRVYELPQAAIEGRARLDEPATFSGPPLPDLRVTVADESTRTDTEGRYLVRAVEPGRQVLRLDGKVRRGSTTPFHAYPGALRFLDLRLPGNLPERPAPRSSATLTRLNPGDRVFVRSSQLKELAPDTHLFVSRIDADGDLRVLVLEDRPVEGGVEARRLTIEAGSAPDGAVRGGVLRWTGTELHVTDLSLRQYRERQLVALLGGRSLRILSRRRLARFGRGRGSRS